MSLCFNNTRSSREVAVQIHDISILIKKHIAALYRLFQFIPLTVYFIVYLINKLELTINL